MSNTQQTSGSKLTPSVRAAAIRRRRRAAIDAASDWEVAALRRRTQAGFWSARVALVASVPFAIVAWAGGTPDAWLVYMLLPVVAAFFAGALFGATILDRHRTTDSSLAGRQGVLVTLVAYCIFSLEVAAMSATPIHTALDYFMGSVLLSGWAVIPIGFFAGVLAFRAREGATKYVPIAGSSLARGHSHAS
ncbi:MAG: hypothetical protein AAGF92_15170 [Myxococcota bacterium]